MCVYFVRSGFLLSSRSREMTRACTSGVSVRHSTRRNRATSMSSASCLSSCAWMPRRSRRASRASSTLYGSVSGNVWWRV